jgi:GNAT superfamily N-acetyltransferase
MTSAAQAIRGRLPDVAPALRVAALQGTAVRPPRWFASRQAIALSTVGAVVVMGPIVLLNWSRWSRVPIQALYRQRRRGIGAPGPEVGVALAARPSPMTEDTGTRVPASEVRDGHPDRSARSGASVDPVELTLGLATARDGTAVRLRPLRRDERDLVAGFYNGLSDDSKYRRFLQPMPRLPNAYLDRLVDVDGHRHVAVVATVDSECAGIARYMALPKEPGAAEVEVTVTDRYQNRGIGRLLVEALVPAAVRAGLTTFVWYVQPTNRPALECLRSLGVEHAYRRDLGLMEGRRRLPDQPLTGEPWTTLTNSGSCWSTRAPDEASRTAPPRGTLLRSP